MLTFEIVEVTSTGCRIAAERPLRIGQQLEFMPSSTVGTVKQRERGTNIYAIETKQAIEPNQTVALKKWWQLAGAPASARTVPAAFFDSALTDAVFSAIAQSLPRDHAAGSIGWDLWWRPDSNHPWLHVLKGNDRYSGSSQHVEPLAIWPAGIWLYRATCFYRTNLVPIAAVSKTIDLLEPQQALSFDYAFVNLGS